MPKHYIDSQVGADSLGVQHVCVPLLDLDTMTLLPMRVHKKGLKINHLQPLRSLS